MIRRRHILTGAAAAPFTGALAAPFVAKAQGKGRVVVVGGGFGGATAARVLRRIDPALEVTLLEPNETFTACPLSNLVVVGARGIAAQQFGYGAVRAAGVTVATARAVSVDPVARMVKGSDGRDYAYDRLILSPGIDIVWGGLPGYDEAAASRFPHAWAAGPQTILLRRRLEDMADGGVVVMSVPPGPYRCPPAPYERASLIAWYLKTHKPRSKLLVLDAKDNFSQKSLFQAAWKQFYPGLLEWVPLSDGGRVLRVDAATGTFETELDSHHADVGTVVPPQCAGAIAAKAGVADRSGWCPINSSTFESTLVPGIHVIGDAAITGALPKSAGAANAEAKLCAGVVVAQMQGESYMVSPLTGSCYSLAAPDFGFSLSGSYRPDKDGFAEVESTASPLDAPDAQRAEAARGGEAWFHAITSGIFH